MIVLALQSFLAACQVPAHFLVVSTTVSVYSSCALGPYSA